MTVLRRAALVAALAPLILAGCGSAAESSGAALDASGTWGQADPGQPNLDLASDGSFTGTDGCNQLGGSWEADGPSVTFSDVRQTLMACDDIDTWLASLSTATVAADLLTVFDEAGAEIGTLSRG